AAPAIGPGRYERRRRLPGHGRSAGPPKEGETPDGEQGAPCEQDGAADPTRDPPRRIAPGSREKPVEAGTREGGEDEPPGHGHAQEGREGTRGRFHRDSIGPRRARSRSSSPRRAAGSDRSNIASGTARSSTSTISTSADAFASRTSRTRK